MSILILSESYQGFTRLRFSDVLPIIMEHFNGIKYDEIWAAIQPSLFLLSSGNISVTRGEEESRINLDIKQYCAAQGNKNIGLRTRRVPGRFAPARQFIRSPPLSQRSRFPLHAAGEFSAVINAELKYFRGATMRCLDGTRLVSRSRSIKRKYGESEPRVCEAI